ncbi:hypothetical protein KEJ21_01585 [Candidatus Bathyarchaeota archaeon]|nr:hypothetical protein [Candidatus Bathyarchaeota archaeon]MBS7630876.1 hypothetical protein [Candidatus Bathyarchaeota archaeon]
MTLDVARADLIRNNEIFLALHEQLADLPIQLTAVRMYDILCWTTEKWVILGKRKAPYGIAMIPEEAIPQKSFTIVKPSSEAKTGFVVYEDLEKASGPKVHNADCIYYRKWLSRPTTTTKWHGPYKTYDDAWRKCQQIAHKTRFEPSFHTCIKLTENTEMIF